MSHRRRPNRPTWHRYAAIAAAVVVIGGGAALASAAASGGSGGGAGHGRTANAAGTPQGGASPTAGTPAAGGTSPSAAPTGTASTSASAKPRSTASPRATAGPGRSAGPSTAAPAGDAGPPHPSSVSVFTGLAFDTCTAPAASTMSAWHAHSPYGAAAVYIGGSNRGCAQPQLTASWMRGVGAAGWKLVPIYVGAQPPCQTSGNPERITASTAASLGASDGADAVARAQGLGMRSPSAVYLDMEAYDTSDTACVDAVLTYIRAWDRALHARGYWAGFYGFTSSSAAAVARAEPATPDLPDALWYARYDGNASTTTGFPFAGTLWTGHRRGHQYQVDSRETYGGAALTVDRDAWDGPVAVIG